MGNPTRNRRDFLQLAAATAAGTCFLSPANAQSDTRFTTKSIPVNLKNLPFAKMPRDFTGLSYEMAQLYNPKFFSSENIALVRAFRELSPHGVLRLGGSLSDMTRWQGDHGDFANDKQSAGIASANAMEWKLTDAFAREHRDGAITPAAIRSLRAFLEATGWTLIYGLCFGSGSPERAADEAACVYEVIGPRLLAFQVGNEDDFFAGNPLFRERGYNFDKYLQEYRQYVAAVRSRTPKAPFAGPDVALNMDWVQQFAEKAEKPVVFLSAHHYAMGPAKDPEMNAERLLNSALDVSGTRQAARARTAVVASGGVPFRMTEGNSCFGGGKLGVSDSFAAALWVADYMLSSAVEGYSGVNLHGGGGSYYTPIETLDDRTATLRPIAYGIQMAERFAGGEVARIHLDTDRNATAYAGESAGKNQLALLNKTDGVMEFALPRELVRLRQSGAWTLKGPSLEAKSGVSFNADRMGHGSGSTLSVPAYTGMLVEYGAKSGAKR